MADVNVELKRSNCIWNYYESLLFPDLQTGIVSALIFTSELKDFVAENMESSSPLHPGLPSALSMVLSVYGIVYLFIVVVCTIP